MSAIWDKDVSDSDSDSYIYDDYPTPEENDLLHHKNDELGVMLTPVPTLHGCGIYTITSVVDPGEFYVFNETGERAAKQKILEEQMRSFYTSENWKENYKIKTDRVFVRRVYAWYNNEKSRWERVRVVGVDTEMKEQVSVERIDYGNTVVVQVADMMEMNPKFSWETPLAYASHLDHVQPIDDNWSQEAINILFKLFNMGTRFHGVIFSTFKTSTTKTTKGVFEKTKSLGLVLVPESDKFGISIQAVLVGLGLAVGTGVGAGHPNLIYSSDVYDSLLEALLDNSSMNTTATAMGGSFKFTTRLEDLLKHPSLNDWQSHEISCKLDCIATASVETLSLQEFEKLSVTSNMQTQALQIEQLTDAEHLEELPAKIRDYLGCVSFSHINGPGNFYIQLESKKNNLNSMMSELTNYIKHNNENLVTTDIKSSQFVAVYYDHGNPKTTWNRAFISETRPVLSYAKVILIDFGIECSVGYDDIRELPTKFLQYSPFCIRAHLNCPHMMPTGRRTWTSEANNVFVEYIMAWSIENPRYFGFIPNVEESVLELCYFDEELAYCQGAKSWINGGKARSTGESSMEYNSLDELKNHPLLRHFFTSLGILIHYDAKSKVDECYKFKPVWDNLEEHGYILPDTIYS